MMAFFKVLDVLCDLSFSVFDYFQITAEIVLNYYYLFATFVQIAVLLHFHTGGKKILIFQALSLLLASWLYSPVYYVKVLYDAFTSILLRHDTLLILGFFLGLTGFMRVYNNFEKARIENNKQQTRSYFRSLRNRRRNYRRRYTY